MSGKEKTSSETASSKLSHDTAKDAIVIIQQEQQQEQQQQQQQDDMDLKNPKDWSKLKKWRNFSIVFFNAFSGYFTSSVYMPATELLRDYFDTNLTVINATIALFVLAMAIAPLFWAPLSEVVGRKPVYVGTMALYTVVTIICATANNLGLFFVMRILQGVFSSAGMTVGGGTAADLFLPHERGRAMSSLTLATVLGPAFSPLLGGYVAQNLGWRWIFYICAIIGGIILLADIFLMQETLYRPQLINQEEKPKTVKARFKNLRFDPFRGLRLVLHLDVFLMCLPTAVGFGWFYYLVTILSPTYSQVYNFDSGSTGLLYLTGGLGNALGAVAAGQASDRTYVYLRDKSPDGTVKKEGRLIPLYVGIPLIVAGTLMYGWFIQARMHWFAPLVGYFLIALGTMYTLVITATYLVDTYIRLSASVVSTSSFTRNIMAMVFSLAADPIRSSLGDGWSYTLAALMHLIFYCVCVPCVHIYGERIRSAHPWWLKNEKRMEPTG